MSSFSPSAFSSFPGARFAQALLFAAFLLVALITAGVVPGGAR
jgi:hypothetical protein